MEIKKLLFVTKFDELRFDALQSLLGLRNAALEHVVFLYVIERDKVAMRRGKGYGKMEELRLKEKANIRFIDWAENLFEQGMEVGGYIVVGGFVQHVVSSCEKEAADLIVIGPPRKGKIEQIYAGSDITEIVRRTQKPLLVYRNPSQKGEVPESPFSRPLLVMDWSPAGERAVAYLKGLNKIVEELNVIHVNDEKDLKGSTVTELQMLRKETRKKLDDICDSLVDAGVNAKPHVYIGDAVNEAEKATEECRATMIIVPTSGKSSWKERFIGSTAGTLAEKSAFPVLIIPDPS
ncbi:MAG: universal stress protein [Deltaproteobacteria bacterium]|nr:universal stress protein [Deltaproteobacteria bacterium]